MGRALTAWLPERMGRQGGPSTGTWRGTSPTTRHWGSRPPRGLWLTTCRTQPRRWRARPASAMTFPPSTPLCAAARASPLRHCEGGPPGQLPRLEHGVRGRPVEPGGPDQGHCQPGRGCDGFQPMCLDPGRLHSCRLLRGRFFLPTPFGKTGRFLAGDRPVFVQS